MKSETDKDNCRWADYTQQSRNRGIFKNNKSGWKGVYWLKERNKWISTIKINKKIKILGYYNNLEEAIKRRKTYESKIKYYE